MGLMADKSMPVNLTFAGRAYDDVTLLKCATAYEAASRRRTAPGYAPPLPSDAIVATEGFTHAARPECKQNPAPPALEPNVSRQFVPMTDFGNLSDRRAVCSIYL